MVVGDEPRDFWALGQWQARRSCPCLRGILSKAALHSAESSGLGNRRYVHYFQLSLLCDLEKVTFLLWVSASLPNGDSRP